MDHGGEFKKMKSGIFINKGRNPHGQLKGVINRLSVENEKLKNRVNDMDNKLDAIIALLQDK